VGRATLQAGWALLMPVIILGGIYGGIFTPTEASAVAVFYALVVGVVVHREIGHGRPARDPEEVGGLVVGDHVHHRQRRPVRLPDHARRRARRDRPVAEGRAADPLLFLLGVNLALFLIGMFIETSAAIIVLAPILVPVAMHFGIDPVHFGIIMVVNLALGMITPPFGVNLFAACTVARISLDRIVRVPAALRAGGHRLPDGHHLLCRVCSRSRALRDLVYCVPGAKRKACTTFGGSTTQAGAASVCICSSSDTRTAPASSQTAWHRPWWRCAPISQR
jgi:C4-dicarboxylate transporter, DctM subunit